MHEVAPAVIWSARVDWPRGQSAHSVAEDWSSSMVPFRHLTHPLADTEAIDPEYVPIGHQSHDSDAGSSAY